MAFGQNSTNGRQFGPNAKVYYVTVKQKNLPSPIFEIKRKKAGTEKEYETVDNKAKFLSGNLIDLYTKENKTKEQKTIKSVSATFVDKDDVYFLTVHHDYLGWNLMNSFCGLKDYTGLEIGLYQSKPKDGQTKTYASVALRQAGQLVKGAFDNKDLPEIPKHKVGDDIISDKTARVAFFIEKMNELSKVVKANNPVASSSNSESNANLVPAGGVDEENDNDGTSIENPDDPPF